MRKCKKCGIEKDEKEFSTCNKKCRVCINAETRSKYNKKKEHERYLRKKAKNHERMKLLGKNNARKWRIKNPEKYIKSLRKSQKKLRIGKKRTEKELKRERIYNKRYRERNKQRFKVYRKVNLALKKGILIKPQICDKCGKEAKSIMGHHEDYNKPLDVIWLCNECHGKVHRTFELKYQHEAG